MVRTISISLSIFICFCIVIATARPAWGYVDPGTGLLALQSIGSALAATAWFVRRRIRNLFARPAPATAAQPDAPASTAKSTRAPKVA